jgi:hypothetical protein
MKLPPGRKTSAWSREEVQKLLSAVARVSPDIFHIVLFLATTGARRGEVLALSWENVDVPKRIIKIWTVPADKKDDSKEQWSPKTRGLHGDRLRPVHRGGALSHPYPEHDTDRTNGSGSLRRHETGERGAARLTRHEGRSQSGPALRFFDPDVEVGQAARAVDAEYGAAVLVPARVRLSRRPLVDAGRSRGRRDHGSPLSRPRLTRVIGWSRGREGNSRTSR